MTGPGIKGTRDGKRKTKKIGCACVTREKRKQDKYRRKKNEKYTREAKDKNEEEKRNRNTEEKEKKRDGNKRHKEKKEVKK